MDSALQTMIDNLPEKTGRSLEDWHKELAKQQFIKHAEAVNFLKSEHNVTHGYANTIVQLYNQKDAPAEDLVETQYKGKEHLLPIYIKLIEVVEKFGNDVVVTPKKTSVSVIRKRQFALIKPATKSRIDLGLKFNDKGVNGRLGNSGPFGTMCTHRVQLTEVSEVDSELINWLQEAYQEA
jgi:hypothetical protein